MNRNRSYQVLFDFTRNYNQLFVVSSNYNGAFSLRVEVTFV